MPRLPHVLGALVVTSALLTSTAAVAAPPPPDSARATGDLVIDDVTLSTEGQTNVCLLDLAFTDATPFEVDADQPVGLGPDGLPVWRNDTTDFDGYTVAVPKAQVPESVAVVRRVFPDRVNHVVRWTSSLAWDGERSVEEICSADFPGQAWMVYVGEYTDNQYTGVQAAFTFRFPGVAPEPPRSAVVAWGEASGKALVGKTVGVGKPRGVRGAKVAYVWKVGRKTVATHRTLRVRKAWTGQQLTAVVGVVKQGFESATRSYRFGRVRR